MHEPWSLVGQSARAEGDPVAVVFFSRDSSAWRSWFEAAITPSEMAKDVGSQLLLRGAPCFRGADPAGKESSQVNLADQGQRVHSEA